MREGKLMMDGFRKDEGCLGFVSRSRVGVHYNDPFLC